MTSTRLIKAEIMKIRTTKTWWWFLAGIVVLTAQSLLRNGISHHYDLYPALEELGPAEQADAVAVAARAHTPAGLAAIAADLMTSGQFLGVLLAMLLGVLLMTNEFFHQTATATFMTNPRRGRVVAAKFAAAAGFGALFWLVSTAINLAATPFYLRSQHVSVTVTDPVVVRSVLLNLLAFVMWAVFGLGLGALVRSQLGAVITGMAGYLVGAAAIAAIVSVIHDLYPQAWVLGAAVIAPALASLVMITPGQAFEHAPPQWAGLAIMVGYALVFTTIGIALIRRRDVT